MRGMLQPTVARRSELRAAPWDGSVVGAKAKDLEQRIKAHQKQKAMADMDRREVDDRGWELGGWKNPNGLCHKKEGSSMVCQVLLADSWFVFSNKFDDGCTLVVPDEPAWLSLMLGERTPRWTCRRCRVCER